MVVTESRSVVTEGGHRITKKHKGIWREGREGMEMFIILIMVRVSQMIHVKFIKLYTKYVKLLYANYNTIKLFEKNVNPSKT